METCHRPFDIEQLRHSDEVQDGDHGFSPVVSLLRGLDVLQDAYFQIPVHQESRLQCAKNGQS